jgi:hypothetical protein
MPYGPLGKSGISSEIEKEKKRRRALKDRKPRTMTRHGKAVPPGHIIKIKGVEWISKGKGRFEEVL